MSYASLYLSSKAELQSLYTRAEFEAGIRVKSLAIWLNESRDFYRYVDCLCGDNELKKRLRQTFVTVRSETELLRVLVGGSNEKTLLSSKRQQQRKRERPSPVNPLQPVPTKNPLEDKSAPSVCDPLEDLLRKPLQEVAEMWGIEDLEEIDDKAKGEYY